MTEASVAHHSARDTSGSKALAEPLDVVVELRHTTGDAGASARGSVKRYVTGPRRVS
jgi:hypothetical protein